MSLTYKNSCDSGQADGTTITVTNATFTGGDAPTSVTIGTTAPTWSSTYHASVGAVSCKHAAASGSTSIWQKQGFTASEFVYRVSFVVSALPAATTSVLQIRSAGAKVAEIFLSNTGIVQVNNFAAATIKSFTTTLVAGTAYDLALRVKALTTSTGEMDMGLFATSSPTTLLETQYTITNGNFGTATPSEFRRGKVSASTATNGFFFFNEYATDVAIGTGNLPPNQATTVPGWPILQMDPTGVFTQVARLFYVHSDGVTLKTPTKVSVLNTTFTVLGDSNTSANQSSLATGLTHGAWPASAQGVPNTLVGGWAMGGANSADMLAAAVSTAARTLVIMAGTNDLSVSKAQTQAQTQSNISGMVSAVGAPKVLVSAIAPCSARVATTVAFNAWLGPWVISQGWDFIDPWEKYRGLNGDWGDASYTSDGTHGTTAVWADVGQILGQAISARF